MNENKEALIKWTEEDLEEWSILVQYYLSGGIDKEIQEDKDLAFQKLTETCLEIESIVRNKVKENLYGWLEQGKDLYEIQHMIDKIISEECEKKEISDKEPDDHTMSDKGFIEHEIYQDLQNCFPILFEVLS
jgi:hypothetical protein